MIIDKELELSTEQAVTVTADSTNYIDLGAARDPGMFDGLDVLVTVTEAVTAAGAATVNFILQSDNDSAFGSPTTVLDSGAIGKATLVAGYQFSFKIPRGIAERYLNLSYTVGTGPLTAGKFTAQVIDGIQKSKAYPNAI